MTQTSFALDLEKPHEPLNMLDTIVRVARTKGRSAFGQAIDLLRLKAGPGKIDIGEYYAFGLYDRSRYSAADRAQFAGLRRQAIDAALVNDRSWYALG